VEGDSPKLAGTEFSEMPRRRSTPLGLIELVYLGHTCGREKVWKIAACFLLGIDTITGSLLLGACVSFL
jgi:hypothetical protein